MRNSFARASIVVLALSACGPGGGQGKTVSMGPPNPLDGIASITVSPATASVTAQSGSNAGTSFTATGKYADGHSADVTSAVSWSLSDASLGSINAGAFAASGTVGGVSQVIATGGSATGNAQLTVKYASTEVSTADGSTAPANSAALFSGATQTDSTLAPGLLYPLDGVVLPNNLGELEVQWSKPSGLAADLFQVAFEGPTIDLRIYTNAPETAGGRISLSPAAWTALAGSTLGSSFTITVTGLASASPTASGASSVVHVTMDADPVNGGIYYWTPTNQGVERHAFGDTSGMASDFYTQADTGGHCVACHVLSRDGKKAMVSFDGGGMGSALLDVATLTQTIPESQGLTINFSSFSPDGTKLIAAHNTGSLAVYDTSGDAMQGTILGNLTPTAGTDQTHPDWSADGKSIVFTQMPTANYASDWDVQVGSIVVMTGPGDGTFANPKVIVQSAGENNYYPSFSPDGKWVLFNRAPSASSYNNTAAEVYVVSADGTIGPIALTNANSAAAMLTNSWPRWSPFVQKYADGTQRLYFTFSSKRNYGIELEQPTDTTTQRPQIWMSAFDPAVAATNKDPSSAPFWLPFQDITTNNHIAQWTTTIIAIQ